jgi:hypothetical protein
MFRSILVVPIAFHLITATATGAPTLDVVPSCRAAATAAILSPGMEQTCIKIEQKAREEIADKWGDFTKADRARCLRSTMIFEPTYTELLTCLEIANETKKLPTELY